MEELILTAQLIEEGIKKTTFMVPAVTCQDGADIWKAAISHGFKSEKR